MPLTFSLGTPRKKFSCGRAQGSQYWLVKASLAASVRLAPPPLQQGSLKNADGARRHRQLRAMLDGSADLAARHRLAHRLDLLRCPFVAATIEHGAAILGRERINRADDAYADRGPGAREGVEPVVEMQGLGLLAGMDADGLVRA
jgi:hypothetical protein